MNATCRLWISLFVVAIMLAACGGPKDSAAPQTPPVPPPPETAEPAPPPAETPPEPPATEEAPAPPDPLEYQPEILIPEEAELLDEEGPGKLYRVGQLLVCVMEGTHKDMGFQHGRLLAEKIRHITKEGYMQKALYGNGYSHEYSIEQARRMEKHFPPEYIEEMQGIVEGVKAAGVEDVTYEELLVAACIAELLHHDPNAPPECSNVAVFGKWTPDGRLLHARNLDWTIGKSAQDDALTLVWRPKDATPFMMLGYAGLIGGVSGMNAAQITIGEMTSSSPEETFDGIPLQIIMRMVVEKASTLDEAVGIIQKGPRTLGWNLVIGDGKIPDARALEVDKNTVDVFTPDDPHETPEMGHKSLPDAIRRTNHPCGETQQKKIVKAMGPRIGIDGSDWEKAKPLTKAFLAGQNTFHRYVWLGEQIEARPGAVDVETALALLANGPVAAGNTLHSFVFDPANEIAYIANAAVEPPETAWKTPYTKLNLSQWF
jgi:predicted choloylglycine hydrolase